MLFQWPVFSLFMNSPLIGLLLIKEGSQWWCWGGGRVVLGRGREKLGKKGLIGVNWIIRLD